MGDRPDKCCLPQANDGRAVVGAAKSYCQKCRTVRNAARFQFAREKGIRPIKVVAALAILLLLYMDEYCCAWASSVSLIFNIVFPPSKVMINCVLQIFCIFLIYPLVKRPIF